MFMPKIVQLYLRNESVKIHIPTDEHVFAYDNGLLVVSYNRSSTEGAEPLPNNSPAEFYLHQASMEKRA